MLSLPILNWIFGSIKPSEASVKRKLEKIKQAVNKDKDKFNRQYNIEAYADNFARMYGYGPQLISALKKIDKKYDELYSSRIKQERRRQELILSVTTYSLKDVHKTAIHRMHSLINEYKKDLEDPNIPTKVKNQIKEDMEEVQKLLDSYSKDFNDFQNRVNKIIDTELSRIEDKEEQKEEKSKTKQDKK